MGMELGFSV